MLQIHKNQVVPHRRLIIRLNKPKLQEPENGIMQIEPGKFVPVWEIHEPVSLNRPIEGWFDTKITVKGDAIFLYIDCLLVFEQKEFLQIPAGKIGFRNDGQEKALVKDIRVTLHPHY